MRFRTARYKRRNDGRQEVAKEEGVVMERRNEVSRPGVRVARALALDEDRSRGRSSWLVLVLAVFSIFAIGLLRLAPAWAAVDDGSAAPDDQAVTRFDAEDDDDDDDPNDDGTDDDGTGVSGTTGVSDPGSLTDGNGHTGPTGNTGTYTDGDGATGPTGDTGPDDGTLTDGNGHTGPTGNTNTATDGRG
jgi:hypothetical protein